MIIVFMWVFMTMIVVMMIVGVRSEYFFEEIDKKKSDNKSINRERRFF